MKVKTSKVKVKNTGRAKLIVSCFLSKDSPSAHTERWLYSGDYILNNIE
jgi:hypothetical protein